MKTKTVAIVKWIAYNRLNGDVSRVYDTEAELDGCYSPNWITMKLSGEAHIEIPEPAASITPSQFKAIHTRWLDSEERLKTSMNFSDYCARQLFPGWEA